MRENMNTKNVISKSLLNVSSNDFTFVDFDEVGTLFTRELFTSEF
jgi:hypothetical protein